MTDTKTPEGGRPVSEMQEKLARTIYESRHGRPVPDAYWQKQVKFFREIVAEYPDHPIGGDGVSDAFREAIAVESLVYNVTYEMRSTLETIYVNLKRSSELDKVVPSILFWMKARGCCPAEISIAKGGKDD